MDLQLLRTAQPDGKLAYGRDSTGRPVALLPGMCKRGLHMLAPSEYRAVVRDGEVHISCPACAAEGADPCWRLTTSGSIPDRAELDDETYRELILDRARATSPWAAELVGVCLLYLDGDFDLSGLPACGYSLPDGIEESGEIFVRRHLLPGLVNAPHPFITAGQGPERGEDRYQQTESVQGLAW